MYKYLYISIFRISRDTSIVKINRYLCDILQRVEISIFIFRISRGTSIIKINRYLCDILQSVQRVKISAGQSLLHPHHYPFVRVRLGK